MKTAISAATALALSALVNIGVSPSTAAATETVTFIPGVYSLAESDLGTAVDTLAVTVTGGVADFVLSGADNATFSVANNSTPLGGRYNPYYTVFTSSWNTSDYPYLTFWSTASFGGVTAGTIPGDQGTNLFNAFQSTPGTGQVFSVAGIPEPSTWAMMILGMASMGAMLRRRSPISSAVSSHLL